MGVIPDVFERSLEIKIPVVDHRRRGTPGDYFLASRMNMKF